MSISTKRGDDGYTSTLRGERLPKFHPITEAVGSLDEANSLLGLARAASVEISLKRIILQVQKHLFIIGAEVSVSRGQERHPKEKISEGHVRWVERLVERFEEALALPPGFVAFGQEESSSHIDVARTGIRRAERIISKMKSEDMVENPHILKYLNRLSDLLFLLACFEEKEINERRRIGSIVRPYMGYGPAVKRAAFITIAVIFMLVTTIVALLLFHKPATNDPLDHMDRHMGVIENNNG